MIRKIHNLDPQPHRHGMLVPKPSAPRVTRCRLGKYWSRDFFHKEAESSRQGVGNPEPYRFSLPLSRSDRLPRRWGQQAASSGRQRNLMMHAQCPLPVYYSRVWCKLHLDSWERHISKSCKSLLNAEMLDLTLVNSHMYVNSTQNCQVAATSMYPLLFVGEDQDLRRGGSM